MSAIPHTRIDHAAPLPLGYASAVTHALALREAHDFSYRVIAAVMADYHGFARSPGWWQEQLAAAGAPPRPRGASFQRRL